MSFFSSKKEESDESAGAVKDTSQPVDDVSSKEANGGGFFSVFRTSSSTNVTTRKNRRKTGGNSPPTTSQAEDMTQRKIVKAKQPPESSGDDANTPLSDTAVAAAEENADDKDIDRDAKRFALPGNAPSVEGEVQQKLSEVTKQDRLDFSASAKKERKEKMIEERRKATVNGSGGTATVEGEGEGEGLDAASSTAAAKPKDPIFSVEAERPEQKRTVANASLSVDPEPVEKKMKGDSFGDDPGGEGEGGNSWMRGATLIAVAAAVALGAFVLLRTVKKK